MTKVKGNNFLKADFTFQTLKEGSKVKCDYIENTSQ